MAYNLSQTVRKSSNFGILFLAIIVFMPVIGGSASFPSQNKCDGSLTIYGRCEAGTISCTIPIGANTCTGGTQTVTYPIPFTNTPTPFFTSLSPDVDTLITTGHADVATNASTWIMPNSGVQSCPNIQAAGCTELFNSVNFRLNDSLGLTLTRLFLHVFILQGSTNASAAIQAQYSINGGVSWNTGIGGGASCIINFGTGTGWFNCQPILGIAVSSTKGVLIRIVGAGGGNAAVIFQRIYFEFVKDLTDQIAPFIQSQSTTQFQWTVKIIGPSAGLASATVTFFWKASSETG